MPQLSPVVNAFNAVAEFVRGVSAMMPTVQSLGSGLNSITKDWAARPLKTFVIKPASLIGDTLKHYNVDLNRHQTCARLFLWSQSAKVTKSFVSAVELITNLPALYEAFSKPITSDGDLIRNYVAITLPTRMMDTSTTPSSTSSACTKEGTMSTTAKPHIADGPRLTPLASIGKRFFNLGVWLMSLSDAASEIKRYRPISSSLDKMVPRIYTFVGGLMGLQGLYEEREFIKRVREDGVELPRFEKVHSLVNVATSVSYCAISFFNGIKMLGYGNQKLPQWMESALFWSNAATVVLPIIQSVVKKYVVDLHNQYQPKHA